MQQDLGTCQTIKEDMLKAGFRWSRCWKTYLHTRTVHGIDTDDGSIIGIAGYSRKTMRAEGLRGAAMPQA